MAPLSSEETREVRGQMPIRNPALAGLILALALSGCSTGPYQKQTAKLAEGMAAARDSFQTLHDEERRSLISHQVLVSMAQGRILETSPACKSPRVLTAAQTFDCAPRRYDEATGQSTRFVPVATSPYGLKLSKVVAAYGETLAELAAAKDVIEVKEAAGKVSSAISSLAAQVSLASPGAAVVTSALSIANWMFGLYLDVRRLDELIMAVEQADPLIEKASTILADEAVELQLAVIDTKSTELRLRRTALNNLRTRGGDPEQIQKLAETFVADSLALDAYGKTVVAKPFVEMRKAHGDLLRSLQQPQVDMAATSIQIQKFADSMIALRDALKKGD